MDIKIIAGFVILIVLVVVFKDQIMSLLSQSGNTDGAFSKGVSCYQGKGAGRNVKEALKHFIDAAEHGHSAAPGMVAMIYKMGDGVEADQVKAYAWLLHASLVAPGNLQGGVIEQIEAIEKALSPEELQRGDKLGEEIKRKVSSTTNGSFQKNGTKGYLTLHKAAQSGVAKSQYLLGEKHFQSHNYKEAMRWFEKATLKGDEEALFRLGEIFYFGKGVPMDSEKAKELYGKAAKLGHQASALALKSFQPK